MRMPLRSRTFCTRLRVWLRCATSVRRWRTRLRRSQNASSGTKLGRPSPNWHTRANQRLSSMSVLRAAQLLHVLRVQQLRIDAGSGECAPRRVPVDAGPLQGRGLDAVPGQPGDQGVQAACQRTEGACLAGRFTARRCAEPHLAILGARGSMGALDEHGAQRAAAVAAAPGATLAGTLVVAGTQPGPGGEATGGAEHARVGTHLTQDGAGRRVVDAGNGFEQAVLRGVVRQGVVDVPVEVLHAPV